MNAEVKIGPEGAYFELSFSPCVELITLVRRFTHDFYQRVLSDHEATSRIAVATHELLENAVRYASDGSTRLRIDVAREPGGTLVTLRTWNRAAETERTALRAIFDELHRFPDPEAYYQMLLRRTVKRTQGSGLGLGRIRAEAGLEVVFEPYGEDGVCLRASGRMAEEAKE